MPKFRVPVRVNVAPVQTYIKVVEVEADTPKSAAMKIRDGITGIMNGPGWRSVGGPLEAIRPERTTYDRYLDEHELDEWVRLQGVK